MGRFQILQCSPIADERGMKIVGATGKLPDLLFRRTPITTGIKLSLALVYDIFFWHEIWFFIILFTNSSKSI